MIVLLGIASYQPILGLSGVPKHLAWSSLTLCKRAPRCRAVFQDNLQRRNYRRISITADRSIDASDRTAANTRRSVPRFPKLSCAEHWFGHDLPEQPTNQCAQPQHNHHPANNESEVRHTADQGQQHNTNEEREEAILANSWFGQT